MSWTGDHFSQATLIAKASLDYAVCCRLDSNSPTGKQGYAFGGYPNFFNHLWRIWKWNNGTVTSLAAGGGNTAVNDVAYFEASGSSLTGKANTVTQVSVTDTDFNAGSPGLLVNDVLLNFEGWDTWSAADLAAGVTYQRLERGIRGL